MNLLVFSSRIKILSNLLNAKMDEDFDKIEQFLSTDVIPEYKTKHEKQNFRRRALKYTIAGNIGVFFITAK